MSSFCLVCRTLIETPFAESDFWLNSTEFWDHMLDSHLNYLLSERGQLAVERMRATLAPAR